MKILRRAFLCLLTFVAFSSAQSQPAADPSAVLFSIADKPVTVDEFVYLYRKNHQHKEDAFNRADVEAYFDLFIRYKLKVAEAMARGLDTTAAFRKEYATYRQELLKSHLGDGQLTDSLVRVAFQRLQEELRAAHILVQVGPDAPPEDTLAAWKRISEAQKRARAGESFAALAAAYSEEPGAAARGGDLGYFTALQMVFPFEQAAYTTPVGSISAPVRTRFGYHLIKVLDRRPSRGEVEVSHIMLRTTPGANDQEVRNRIFDLHDRLRAGMAWEEVCRQFSEDPNTRETGGRLRPFGVGAMNAVPAFQDAAFSLETPGEISDPVQTAFGWHILRLEAKIPLPPFEEWKTSLTQRVRRDERMALAVAARRDRLLSQSGYQENTPAVKKLMTDDSVGLSPDELLFSLGGKAMHVRDFLAYVKEAAGSDDTDDSRRARYNDFVDEVLRTQVEARVLAESPDYRWLLQEYYEGILLFEIMEQEIWNKAMEDSAGQHRYFTAHADAYRAGERAVAVIYSGATRDRLDELKRLLAEGLAVEEFVVKHAIRLDSGIFEKSDRLVLADIPWEPGLHETTASGLHHVVNIRRIVPPGPQSFPEARAAVISDYQTFLEDAWIQELKRKFAVRVRKKAKKRAFRLLLNP